MQQEGERPAPLRSYVLLDKLLSSWFYRAAYYVHRAVLMTKVALVIAMLACIIFVKLVIGSAHATSATNPGYVKAYGYALRCFVAGGVIAPKPQDDPDGTATKSVREYARKAYDAVYILGGKLGYAPNRIARDLDRAQGTETRLMVQNPNYLAQATSECVRLGLMQATGG